MQARIATVWRGLSPTTRGITMMVVATICFSVMHATIRYLAKDLHPIQMAFFRNFFGVIVFLPVIARSGFGFLRTERLGMHAIRGVLNICAMFAFFTGLSMTPIARVTALSFTGPIFMAILSVILLGERIYLRRTLAILGGFIGMLVVLRPGVSEIDTGSLLVILSAMFWSVALIVIKVLSRTETSLTITGYMTIFLSLFSFGPALWVWQTPSMEAWVLLVVMGVTGTFAQLTLAESLKQADAGVIMPFDFLKLVWASLLGFLLFSEMPDGWTLVGAVIIFASGTYIAIREGQTRKPPTP